MSTSRLRRLTYWIVLLAVALVAVATFVITDSPLATAVIIGLAVMGGAADVAYTAWLERVSPTSELEDQRTRRTGFWVLVGLILAPPTLMLVWTGQPGPALKALVILLAVAAFGWFTSARVFWLNRWGRSRGF